MSTDELSGEEALAVDGGPEAAAAFDPPAWPYPAENSAEYVTEALESNSWTRLGGKWVERFEEEFADYHDAEHAIAVSNGTVAIELALRACGVRPGDEVLVPPWTFIASASAITVTGAIPRFVDVDPVTANLDPDALEAALTEDTVGVVGVHIGGYPMDLDDILPIVEENDLFLIEDSSHAHGTEFDGEKIGTFGDVGTFSCQNSKMLPSGEGGVITTDDDRIAEQAELIHNIGRVPGETDYDYYLHASNYRLSEIQGALLVSQLEKLDAEVQHCRENTHRLADELADIEGIHTRPLDDDRVTVNGYWFHFHYDPAAFGGMDRETFRDLLRAEGVPTSTGYQRSLGVQPAFDREEIGKFAPDDADIPIYRNQHLPGVEELSRTVVTLSPMALLADAEGVVAVADAIRKIREHATA